MLKRVIRLGVLQDLCESIIIVRQLVANIQTTMTCLSLSQVVHIQAPSAPRSVCIQPHSLHYTFPLGSIEESGAFGQYFNYWVVLN